MAYLFTEMLTGGVLGTTAVPLSEKQMRKEKANAKSCDEHNQIKRRQKAD